jgi:O-antigen ligase
MAETSDRGRAARRAVVPLLLAGVLLVAALRGGSYDVLARKELFFFTWWTFALGVAVGVLPRMHPPRATSAAILLLIALGGWTALGLIWTESAERTYTEVARLLGFSGVMLLVAWSIGPGEWRGAAATIAAAAILVCGLGFFSRLAPNVLSSTLEQAGVDTRRLAYPFNYWNAVGVWAAMTVSLALAWSAHATHWPVRGMALVGVCVAVPVAYLAYSRTAAVTVVLAVLAVVMLSRHRWLAAFNAIVAGAGSALVIAVIRANPEIAQNTGTAGARDIVIAFLGAAVVCMLAAAGAAGRLDAVRLPRRVTRAVVASAIGAALVFSVIMGPALADRAWDSFQQRAPSGTSRDPATRLTNLSGERRVLWDVALDAFKEEPLHGMGGGTYEFAWNQDPRWSHDVVDAHSLYIESLAEFGLPGAVLLVAAFTALFTGALLARARAPDPEAVGAIAGCAGSFLVFCVAAGVDWMWESPAVAVTALTCGVVAASPQGRGWSESRRKPRLLGGLLGLVMLAAILPGLIALSSVRASQAEIRGNRAVEAIAEATNAIEVMPWGASGYLQRALVLEQLGHLDAAARDAQHAIRRESTNFAHWWILARIEVERGRVPAALRAAERARALKPNSPLFKPGG